MTLDEQGFGQEIDDLSRAAETLIAGPPEFLRAFTGDEAGSRAQRRAIVIASLREQEAQGRVGVSVDELAADLEAVLRRRGQPLPRRSLDLRAEVVEILRQLEGWNAVDGGLAPERAERDGLRRRVERDYALARSLRVFLPRWDEVQRLLRRRYISLSANYFAQAIAALDTLLEELNYEDTDPLRCHTAWQSLHQALHGINTETRDFARELRSLRVDGNHPEVLAEIADRLGILHEKFFRVAAEGAAKVRDRLELLRDERHDGENVSRLQDALRAREEEWSVGIGETKAERLERLDEVARDVRKELNIFDRFMADGGPGSWREGAKIISLALVDLTERIHAAISLRLQQTQAIAALHRRAKDLAEGIDRARGSAQRASANAPTARHRSNAQRQSRVATRASGCNAPASISGTPPARYTPPCGYTPCRRATTRYAWSAGCSRRAARRCRWWTTRPGSARFARGCARAAAAAASTGAARRLGSRLRSAHPRAGGGPRAPGRATHRRRVHGQAGIPALVRGAAAARRVPLAAAQQRATAPPGVAHPGAWLGDGVASDAARPRLRGRTG